MAKIPLVPLKSQIDRLQSAYSGAARRIVDILSALDPQTFTSADHGAVLRKAQEVIVVLNDQVRSWAPVAIRAAYQESAGVARTRLELIGAKILPANRYNPARHDRKIDALTKFVLRDLYKANLTIERTVKRYLAVILHAAKRIDRTRIQEFDYEEAMRWITRFLKKVWPDDPDEASQARGSISRQIRDYLLSKLEGQDFIRINGRNYGVRDYAELMARTRMREAQTEAVKEMMRQFDNDLVEIPPHDSPCAEICAPYQGKVYSISGAHPKYPLLPDGGPPWHPNCLLPGTRVISPGGVVSGHRAFYRGQAIELSFSEGSHLAVTVNHMLLTPQGFAPAHLLRKGDDVFYCPGFEGIIAPGPDGDKRPPLIEDVIRALAEASGMTTTRVPVTPEYLHGDGRFCDGQIDIIRTNGLLLDDGQTGPAEPGGKDSFDPRGVALPDLFPDGSLSQVLHRAAHAADSIMGGRRTPSPVFLARSGSGDAMRLTDAPDWNSSHDKPAMDALGEYSKTLSQILFETSGLIKTTKLVNVRVFQFSGHVYDLQSATSLYLGNSLVSSNCEDVMNPTSENALRWRTA